MLSYGLTVINLVFKDNTATAGNGGGAWVDVTATLTNCSFTGNKSLGNYAGGGLYINDDDISLTNCLIAGNEAASGRAPGFANGSDDLYRHYRNADRHHPHGIERVGSRQAGNESYLVVGSYYSRYFGHDCRHLLGHNGYQWLFGQHQFDAHQYALHQHPYPARARLARLREYPRPGRYHPRRHRAVHLPVVSERADFAQSNFPYPHSKHGKHGSDGNLFGGRDGCL